MPKQMDRFESGTLDGDRGVHESCTGPAQRGERGERRSGQRAGPLAARAWHAVAISGPFVCCEKVQKDQINYARKNFSDAKESQASATSHDSRPAATPQPYSISSSFVLGEEPSCCTRLLPQSRFWPFAKSVV